MKKLFFLRKPALIAVLAAALLGQLLLSAGATSARYSWYCAHVKGHARPSAPAELRFVESLGGYYIDPRPSVAQGRDKVIYLTFDAGYENGNVARVLDVLREREVPAAFFVLSHLVTEHPALVERMFAEGHTVCNHTARHKDMSGVEDAAFLSELHALEETVRRETGRELCRFYRPPEGRFSKENLAAAQEDGYRTVFWSFAYPDWDNRRQPACDRARKTVLDNLHSGEVMLLHPTSATNAAILGEIIDAARSEGYRFGRLEELTGGGE